MAEFKKKQKQKYSEDEDFTPIETFDDCDMCRFLRSLEGSPERHKLIAEFEKKDNKINGCACIMDAMDRQWVSHEFQELVKEPSFERKGPKQIDGFKIPDWWECQWRRIPCRGADCTFCDRFQKLENLIREEDKDKELIEKDNEAKIEQNFDDLRKVVRYQAKDLGIPEEWLLGGGPEITEGDFDEDGHLIEDPNEDLDEYDMPPEPEKFLLYKIVRRWSRPVSPFIYTAEEKKKLWAKSEAAQDFAWYATLLPAKVYRQLSTRWETSHAPDDEKEEAEEFARIELGYTGYVLRECLRIIEHSLKELCKDNKLPEHPQFKESLRRFRRLKPLVLNIAKKHV